MASVPPALPSTARVLGADRRIGAAIFLVAFFAILLGSSREETWADARPIFEVAESIVHHGKLDIVTSWPPTLPRGVDGKVYAAAPLVQSLVHVPGAALRQALAHFFPASFGLSKPMAAHLGPALAGALACVLVFGICRRLGASRRAALVTAGATALASTLWVYARYPYSEVLQAACYAGLFGALLALADAPTSGRAARLGLWAGLLVATKPIYLFALPGAWAMLLLRLAGRPRTLVRVHLWAAAGLAPSLVMVLAYNTIRWGSPLSTGYAVGAGVFDENPLVGLWGMLLSPGKSAFLYSPPLVLGAMALPELARQAPRALWAALATAGPVVVLSAALLFWAGDWAWGPRYLVFAVPVMIVPMSLLVDRALTLPRARHRRAAAGGIGLVLALGGLVQLLGAAFYWDHFVRLSQEARHNWLGMPDRSGAAVPVNGESCGGCFEDMHALQWLPPFQAIAGHYWLMRHVPAGDDWRAAEKDAPWRPYTDLPLNIASTYPRARLDWWFLDFAPHARIRPFGIALGLALAGALGASIAMLVRASRRAGLASGS